MRMIDENIAPNGVSPTLPHRPLASRRAVLPLLLATLLWGCSGQDTTDITQDELEPIMGGGGWQLVERDYPYTGDYGEMICAYYERPAPEASDANPELKEVDIEFYNPELMNERLGSTDPNDVDQEVAEVLRRKGITRIETCEDAREYVRTRHSILESNPSVTPRVLEGGSEPPLEGASEGELEDKIFDGQAWNHASTAEVRRWTSMTSFARCSGSLIGDRFLVTAAHCFPSNGFFPITVRGGTGPACITDTVGGGTNCDLPPSSGGALFSNIQVVRNPGWSGSADRDLAVAAGGFNWLAPANTSASWIRLSSVAGAVSASYWTTGYGHSANPSGGSGTRRLTLMDNTMDFSGALHFYTNAVAGRGRACKGDSGGPAIYTGFGFDMVFGVTSQGQLTGANQCPTVGQLWRSANIEGAWVESVVESGGQPCGNFQTSGWDYIRCW